MTEEELEGRIQSHDVENALLPHFETGRYATNYTALEAITCEHERKICSTFLFRLPQAWRKTKGDGVRVALLDTGVDTNHSDLANSIIKMKDFTGQGVEDLNGHGTYCAGVIGANPIRAGLTGVAPECQLLVGKVLNNDGSGDFSDIADGVDWAVDSGAHIITMSMCGPSSSPLLYRSITYALAKGVHIICAAGNTDKSPETIGYPSRYGGAITVGCHDHVGISSLGRELGLTAPGVDIWSTYKGGSYRELSGCSVATSFVAGIAALIVSRHLLLPQPNTPIFNCEDLLAHLTAMTSSPRHNSSARESQQLPPFLVAGSRA
jgi:subtilisin family serine protease